MASQVTVFVENRPGRISRIARVLADQDINIRAITISDMGEYGLINIICNDPDRAENILSQKGYSVSRKYVIGILMEDRPGAMAAITEYLQTKNINISNAYGFILKKGERAVLVLEVDDFDKAERMIRKGGFHTLTMEELQNL
ncbi:MAG: ACT domain-containing protein [Spirochaetota bacterium]|nr:MAG: ACT domain-containing protein [Spirochaetota bacterium]